MRKYILYLVIGFCFLHCTKSPFNDLAGSKTLKGVALIYDTLNGIPGPIAAKNMKIFLKYTGSNNSYLYSTAADAGGQFNFAGISPEQGYTIYAAADTGGIKYYGEIIYTSGSYNSNRSDTLRLYPSAGNQNGIHVVVTGQGLPVPNVTAWIFNNAGLFAADTSAGRVFDVPVNSYGVGNKLNIAAGTYYLRVKTRIGTKDYTGEDTVQVTKTGITNAYIPLTTVPLPRNGIEAHVSDIYGTPVADAKVYGYRSRLVFENDTLTFSNSLFSITSGAGGLAATYLIDPGTYYLRAVKVINKDTLKATATVIVGASKPESAYLTVIK